MLQPEVRVEDEWYNNGASGSQNGISVWQTTQTHHKISLYADGLLFLQNPQSSLQEVVKLIHLYPQIADFRNKLE